MSSVKHGAGVARLLARRAKKLPTAVFDSGVGGLTVLHECLVSLPGQGAAEVEREIGGHSGCRIETLRRGSGRGHGWVLREYDEAGNPTGSVIRWHPGGGRHRRADAQRNADRILDAAVACLSGNPEASVSEIAQTAGVGRVTLYGHFASRGALVEAALSRVLDEGDKVLESLDLTGDPREALRTLIESGWLLMAQSSAILEAAQATLPPGRIQELHAKPAQRVEALIRRGQSENVFRADLPATWLTSILHHIMKGAAVDVGKGRLDKADAPRFISEAVLSACRSGRPIRGG